MGLPVTATVTEAERLAGRRGCGKTDRPDARVPAGQGKLPFTYRYKPDSHMRLRTELKAVVLVESLRCGKNRFGVKV